MDSHTPKQQNKTQKRTRKSENRNKNTNPLTERPAVAAVDPTVVKAANLEKKAVNPT